MTKVPELSEALTAWNQIPNEIKKSIRGLRESDLDLRGGAGGWSVRENVHHLVEANIIASNMIIAALATDGCDFDWTWVNPNKAWMRRVGYDKADVEVSIGALRALGKHISALIAAQPDAMRRRVRLNDAPGDPRYVMTVEKILQQEVEHAKDHLENVVAVRRQHSI